MKKFFKLTIILLIVGSTIHCGNPLESESSVWISISIPDNIRTSDHCSIVANENGTVYLCASSVTSETDSVDLVSRTVLYEYSNNEFTELVDIDGIGYIYDYSKDMLWGYHKSSSGIQSIFYYDDTLSIVNVPHNQEILDIAAFNYGSKSGCLFSTSTGIYKYSINSGNFESLGFPNFSGITRADNDRFFFLERGESYTVGVMDTVDSDIVLETVPIPFKNWSFREGPGVFGVYVLGKYSECSIGPYFVFIAELGIDDVWYQSIILRNNNKAGEGVYEVLLLNPLGGPYAYAMSSIAGFERDNMRAVGVFGTNFVCRDGIWVKENDSSTNYHMFYDLISTDTDYMVLHRTPYFGGDISLFSSPH